MNEREQQTVEHIANHPPMTLEQQAEAAASDPIYTESRADRVAAFDDYVARSDTPECTESYWKYRLRTDADYAIVEELCKRVHRLEAALRALASPCGASGADLNALKEVCRDERL